MASEPRGAPMSSTYLYQDHQIRITLPVYLRQFRGAPIFKADRRRNKTPLLFTVSIRLDPDELRAEHWRNTLQSFHDLEWMDSVRRVVLQGPARKVPEGFELLATLTGPFGVVNCEYHLFVRQKQWFVYFLVHGQGDVDEFLAACDSLFETFALVES
jgi:hypothetical protein